jgi:hypothetical protein
MHTLAQQLDFSIFTPGQKDWGSVSETGLTFNEGTEYSEWEQVTKTAAALYQGSYRTHARAMFLLGDALRFGDAAYGETAAQVIDNTRAEMRLHAKTVQNAGWIASSIPAENRHLETLSFAHHEAVAKLEPEDQAVMLQAAEDEGMSVKELKSRVKETHPSPGSGAKNPKSAKVVPTTVSVADAIEIVLMAFAPHLEGKKPLKITDEQRAEYGTAMQELYKLARKFVRKGNW